STAWLVVALLMSWEASAQGTKKPEPRGDLIATGNEQGWVSLFDGKTLSGWTTADNTPGRWKVEDGAITSSGPASHLFSPRGDYKNFRYRADIKINDKGNSGMYSLTAT